MSDFLKLLPLIFALTACASKDPKPAPAAPAEAKVASPAPATIKAVETKNPPKAWGRFGTTFSWNDRSFRVYEAHAKLKDATPDEQRMYGFGPVVEIKEGTKRKVLDLRELAPKDVVSHVFHDSANRKIWVLTEYGVAGPSRNYSLWISEDGGDTWFRGGDLRRPGDHHPPADLVTIWLDGDGRGEALFTLENDAAPDGEEPGKGLKRGLEVHFRSVTQDGGRTWFQDPAQVRWNGMTKVR